MFSRRRSLFDFTRGHLTKAPRRQKRRKQKQADLAGDYHTRLSVEQLEDRRLLAVVSYDAVTNELIFTADAGESDEVQLIGNAGADTLQILVDNGDALTLAGDALANADFVLSTTTTVDDTLTIDLSGSPVDDLEINAGDLNDIIDASALNGVIGSQLTINGGAGNDQILGSQLGDILNGNGGNDTIDGLGGDDLIISDGTDTIDAGTGNDTVDFSAAAASIIVDLDVNSAGAAGTPSQDGGILNAPPGAVAVGGVVPAANILFEVDDVENVIGTPFNDGLFGNNEVNVLQGGDGSDSIHGFAGDDFLEGGLGIDTVLFTAAPAGVVVDLNDQVSATDFSDIVNGLLPPVFAASGGAGNNVLSAFENITGSQNDDTLIGDGNGNTILGNNGNDDITLSPGIFANLANGGDPTTFVGDNLTVDLAGTTGAVLTIFGPDAGQITFTSGEAPIDFSEIERLDAINGVLVVAPINTGAGDDDINVSLDGGDLLININGQDFFRINQALIDSPLTFNGQAGNDTLTVDSSNGLINVPGGVRFDGGAGFDAVNAVQVGGPTIIEENLFIGATPGNGIHELVGVTTQTIEFSNLEPFTTNVVAPVFNITSTPNLASLLQDDNQINYEQGALLGPNAGRVTVDDFEPIEFINKTTLVIEAGAGDDVVNLNNSATPTGLTGITVNASDPTTSDTVIVNGTTGFDDILVDTLTDDGAVVTGAQPVPVTIDTAESLVINGLGDVGGGDNLTIVANPGEVFYTPGTSEDSGTFSTQSSAFGPFQEFLPISFQDLGAGGELSVQSTTGTRTLDLIVRGTDVADDFEVDATGEVQVFRSDSNGFFVTLPIQTPGVNDLFLEGLAGDDVFDIDGNHPFTSGISIAGGTPSSGSDVLNFLGSGVGEVTVDLEAETITEAGFGAVSYAGVETVNIDANTALTVVGTTGDDVLNVTPAGVDSGSFTHDGTPGVLFNYNDVGGANGVTYDLGDGEDQLNLFGDAANNNFLVEQDANDAPLTTFVASGLINSFVSANLELLTVNGLGGDDNLTVDVDNGVVTTPIFFDGGTGSDLLTTTGDPGVFLNAVYTPGLQPDEGRLEYNGDDDLIIDFDNLEPVVDLIVAASLTVNGNADDNQITYSAGAGNNGLVSIDGFETIEFANKTTLVINALGGDDTIVADNDFATTGLETLSFNGNEGDDTIRFDSLPSAAFTTLVSALADGGSGDDIIDGSGVDLDTPLELSGGSENDTIIGGAGDDSLFGGLGDDTLVDSLGNDTFDGGLGLDTILIEGSNSADLISVFQEAPSAVVGDEYELTVTNGSLFAPPAATTELIVSSFPALAPNDPVNVPSVERIQINALSGDDVISVGVSDEYVVQGLETQTLAFEVDGGLPNASDRLVVLDDGLGDTVIQRIGADDRSGSFTIGATAPIDYSNIEFADLVPLDPITAATGTDGLGRLAVFKNDPFEANNSLPNATFLGAGPTINVDPTIDPAGIVLPFPFPPVPGDSDFFQFVAQDTGTLDFQLFFEPIATLGNGRAGLPGDGELVATFFDNDGNVIGSSTPLDVFDASGNKIGERITLPVVIDETYFVQVQGETADAINVYNFTAIIDPAPIPQVVDLTAPTDSGRNNTDDITFFDANINGAAVFNIVLDDARLDEFANQDLIPDTVDDDAQTLLNAGGVQIDYGVEVFNNGESIGFAFLLADSTWQFTATAGDLQEGDFNHISAAVWIRDAADPAVINRGELSLPLQIELDTIEPPVQFGVPADLDGLVDSSDTGVLTDPATFGDRVTSDTTPTFVGQAEANSIVRIFADLNNNGVLDMFDQLIGQTTTVPLDGNLANPLNNNFWEITSAADLNELFGVRDGLRRLFVTAEDVAGNVNGIDPLGDPLQTLEIFIDTQGPQIFDPPGAETPVHPTAFPEFDLFDPKPLQNGFTPLFDQITINISDLPNRSNVDPNFLYNALQQEIAEDVGNYSLVGDHVGTIGIIDVQVINDAPVNGQPATAEIILTFADFVPDDRFTLTISENLVDPAGNNLDGESNANGPLEDPTFPSGDDIPGGDFVARFTVDSRPEIGTFVPQNINIDINGNFTFDPNTTTLGDDFTNDDLTFTLDAADPADGSVIPGGFGVNDLAFAGQFTNGNAPASGNFFDQLAAFGFASELGQFRWLVDTNSDGIINTADGDFFNIQPLLPNFDIAGAIPLAGNADGDATNGDEIGLYNQGVFAFDLNRDFIIQPGEVTGNTGLLGHPIVGDFDGDTVDDIGVFNNNVLTFDLAFDGFGFQDIDGTIVFGFPGVLDRPVAADFDQDGIDDVGLFVPGNSANLDRQQAEWFLLISGDPTGANRVFGTVNTLDHPFETVPFGNDIFAQFGDELALPIVGNFDPPVAVVTEENDPPGVFDENTDFDEDGDVDGADFLAWQLSASSSSANTASALQSGSSITGDGNNDGLVNQEDLALLIADFGQSSGQASASAGVASTSTAVAASTSSGLSGIASTFALAAVPVEDTEARELAFSSLGETPQQGSLADDQLLLPSLDSFAVDAEELLIREVESDPRALAFGEDEDSLLAIL